MMDISKLKEAGIAIVEFADELESYVVSLNTRVEQIEKTSEEKNKDIASILRTVADRLEHQ